MDRSPKIIGNLSASDIEALNALGRTTSGELVLSLSSHTADMAEIRTGVASQPKLGSGTDLIAKRISGKWVIVAKIRRLG